MNASNSNLSRPLTSPAFSVAPNYDRKNMKAKIETNLECRDGSAVPMQRLQIAWSDCIWTPKASRVSQVKNARPFLVRHRVEDSSDASSTRCRSDDVIRATKVRLEIRRFFSNHH